jgi:hypothetical protein
MNERNDQLKDLIHNGQIDRAIEIVRSAADFMEAERFVLTVLSEEKSTPELVEAVLEVFLLTRVNRYPEHGLWVHSLSHFTEILWERRLDGWLKKFYGIAFKGANELHDPLCCDRLVRYFGMYAKFSDDPADFALTPENMNWMNWDLAMHFARYAKSSDNPADFALPPKNVHSIKWMEWKVDSYVKARIEAGRFDSEEAFLRWKLRRPETYTTFDYDAQTILVNVDEIQSIIQQLQDLGADTSEFKGLERNLLTMLTKRLGQLEVELREVTERDPDWRRKGLKIAIQKTRAALVALTSSQK